MINALKKIIVKLTEIKTTYMIIGGLANGIHGNPRKTFDIDMKEQIEAFHKEKISHLANMQKTLCLLWVE